MTMPTTVIRQSRDKLSYLLIGSVAGIAISEWMRTHAGERYAPEHYQFWGAIGVAFWMAMAVLAIVQLARPARLMIAPEGLTYEGPWWRETWAWSELGEFVVENYYRMRVIWFAAPERHGAFGRLWRPDGRRMLPGVWRPDVVEVCEQLNAARDRWGAIPS